MGILTLNGNRIVLNGDTISLGGPDPAPTSGKPPEMILMVSPGRMMIR